MNDRLIDEASRLHVSVGGDLRGSPRVLSFTRDIVVHDPIAVGKIGPPDWWTCRASADHVIPDHWAVRKALSLGDGEVSARYAGFNHPLRTARLGAAMRDHREHGYEIPERHIDDAEVSYGENEAWVAAQHLVRGATRFTGGRPLLPGGSLLPQVAVPRRHDADRVSPYVLDQLWVVPWGEKYRLIALEVDGEAHFGGGEAERSAARDARLRDAGYEVVHVAGWWCRIDPWRVIAEAISTMNVTPVRLRMPGDEIESIDGYGCALCGEWVVRFDWDDLVRFGDIGVVHVQCATEATEDRDSDQIDERIDFEIEDSIGDTFGELAIAQRTHRDASATGAGERRALLREGNLFLKRESEREP